MTKRLTDEEAVIMARVALGSPPIDASDEYPVWMLDGVNVSDTVYGLIRRKRLGHWLRKRDPANAHSPMEAVLCLPGDVR